MKINMKQLSLAIVGVVGFYSGAANAQFAVADVNIPLYFDPMAGLFTKAMGQQNNAVKGAVDTLRITQEVAIKQQDILSQQNDMRMRQALGEAEIAKRDINLQPTVAQCIELTSRWAKVGAGGGSVKPAASGTAVDLNQRLATNNVGSGSDTVAKQVQTMKPSLQTCDPTDVAGGLAACSTVGNLVGADLRSVSLDANTNKSKLTAVSKQDGVNSDGTLKPGVIANYSLENPEFQASLQNINNKIYYAPEFKSIDPNLLKQNKDKAEDYKTLYDLIFSKLDTSYQALVNIMSFSRAGDLPKDSLAGKNWADNKADFDTIFMNRLTFPVNPSLRDMVNFEVHRDFYGVAEKNEQMNSEIELLKSINQRLAVSNLIAYKQYELMVDNNKINAQMLTQSVTPLTTSDLKDAANRIAPLKN